MKKSLLALASGAFILGAAEFVMMGILPQAAAATGVDIPTAGHYISAYAIGVCFGTLILVFGARCRPKSLIILFMVIALVGNLASAFSVNAAMLVVARFAPACRTAHSSAQPHSSPRLWRRKARSAGRIRDGHRTDRGQYARCTGGHLDGRVPFLRLAFGILTAWAAMTIVLALAWIPYVAPIKDAASPVSSSSSPAVARG